MRNAHETCALADALAEHIVSTLDNLSDAQAAEQRARSRSRITAVGKRARFWGEADASLRTYNVRY